MRFGSMADHPIWSVPLLLTDKAEEEQDERREKRGEENDGELKKGK